MKKITRYICLALTPGLLAQCNDYLDTTNPGQSDDEFVTSSPEEAYKTLSWTYGEYRTNIVAGGNYNYQDVLGSDAEYMSEYPTANNVIARLQPEATGINALRSEEHTSELQSRENLVCRLLLEKKKRKNQSN